MELILPSPSPSCSTPITPFFTAPSSPSYSLPSYPSYDDGDSSTRHHRFSLAFDCWGGQPDFTLLPYYDPGVDDDETGYDGDFEFEFNGFPGKVSSASANDLFLEGKIRSLSGVSSNEKMDSAGDYERDDGDRIECYSCPTPRLRVCDILVQGDEEEEEEDGGEGDSLFEPAGQDRMAAAEATATATTCSVGYLSSLLPGVSLLRNRRNHRKSWSFKDFLFRSTSEGRGTSKAAKLAKGTSPPEMRGRGRQGGAASSHKLHYHANQMVSEERRWRTALPYKHGFFAC